MEAKSFTTERTEDQGERPRHITDYTDFRKACICAGLQSTRVIGQIIWAGFTARWCYPTDNLGPVYKTRALSDVCAKFVY